MEKIQFLEEIKTEEQLKAKGIHPKVYSAYRNAIERENVLLDFSGCVSNSEVKEIVESLKKCEIGAFTISNDASGLLELLHQFERNDCQIAELTLVNSCFKDWITGKFETVPAIKLTVEYVD